MVRNCGTSRENGYCRLLILGISNFRIFGRFCLRSHAFPLWQVSNCLSLGAPRGFGSTKWLRWSPSPHVLCCLIVTKFNPETLGLMPIGGAARKTPRKDVWFTSRWRIQAANTNSLVWHGMASHRMVSRFVTPTDGSAEAYSFGLKGLCRTGRPEGTWSMAMSHSWLC